MMLFDSVVLLLMIIRTAKLYLQSGVNALTVVLLRDQILFYALTFAAALANLVCSDFCLCFVSLTIPQADQLHQEGRES